MPRELPGPPEPRPVAPELATGPPRPFGEVRLAYADGSAVRLHPDDPRARAFRALADELARPDPDRSGRRRRRG